MTSRRDLFKGAAVFGGAAAFAAGFSETAERMLETVVSPAHARGTTGNSQKPEFRVTPAGDLELDPDTRTAFTLCQGCTTLCGVRVRIDAKTDTVTRVTGNPYSPLSTDPHVPMGTPVRKALLSLTRHNEAGLAGRSTACGRGNAVLEQQTSPYRVTAPMKRVGQRNSGRWEPISFEQLIHEVVEGGDLFGEGHVKGLRELRSFDPIDPAAPELGPKVNKVALLASVADGRNPFVARFVQKAYGSINMTGHGSYCGGSYRAGSGAAFGDTKTMPHAKPDIPSAEFVIFMGTAPANAGNPFKRFGTLLAKARTDGSMKYVIVDPVLGHSDNEAAKDRGRWVPIRPGTDAALAMAMIRWILDENRYDATFLAQPSLAAAKAAGEVAWSNATHLVIADPAHARFGRFLRGSDVGAAVAETLDLARRGARNPVGHARKLARRGAEARRDIVDRLQKLRPQRRVRRIGGEQIGSVEQLAQPGCDPVRIVAHCGLDLVHPVEFGRRALGVARRNARILNEPLVDRTRHALDRHAARFDRAAIERHVARRLILDQFERTPRIAGRLRVGDIVADRR